MPPFAVRNEVFEMFSQFIKWAVDNYGIVLLGSVTLIQIAPIKLNPWTKIFNYIGQCVNGEMRNDLAELKRDFEETKANDMRWNILNFAASCRKDEKHSREEWKHAIAQIKEYEEYTKTKHINNGVIEEDSKYLRSLYQDRCIKNDFL